MPKNSQLRILIPTAGSMPTIEIADYAIEVAQVLGANLYILHVIRPGQSRESAELAIEVFDDSAAAKISLFRGVVVNIGRSCRCLNYDINGFVLRDVTIVGDR